MKIKFASEEEFQQFKTELEGLRGRLGDDFSRYPTGSGYDLYTFLSEVARNTCPRCLTGKHAVRKNYDMMWGEADLVCGKCGTHIRDMDFG